MTSPDGTLRWGGRAFAPGQTAVMAIVNATPDSFFAAGRSPGLDAGLQRVAEAVEQGADIVDIGGVKAGVGAPVSVEEELDRVLPLVGEVRSRWPELVISVDTWRAPVGAAVCQAGADVLNDAWGGADPELAVVAARYGAGLVCAHTGGAAPRTNPHRAWWDDVVGEAVSSLDAAARAAVALGVRSDGIVIDPAHDFGKNSRHSLALTAATGKLAVTGWPVLVALSRKDFIGEVLDAPPAERLEGTLAATAICAWLGARVFRVHDVAATRRVLDTVAAIHGDRDLALARRGLV